jgi:hypothetical protein
LARSCSGFSESNRRVFLFFLGRFFLGVGGGATRRLGSRGVKGTICALVLASVDLGRRRLCLAALSSADKHQLRRTDREQYHEEQDAEGQPEFPELSPPDVATPKVDRRRSGRVG